jgi:predicted nucleotidyltransferase component of viral defense system
MSESPALQPLRVRLEAVAGLGYPFATVEKDYAISYVLAGIARTSDMDAVVFKGGTLLRKIYFSNYRFSEDLDFSALKTVKCDALLGLLQAACDGATAAAAAHSTLQFTVKATNVRSPHAMGQCEFWISAQFPWHRTEAAATRIKVEVSMHEHLVFSHARRAVLHGYSGETLVAQLPSYDLHEVAAEKVRSFLQASRHLKEKGWVNPRARDLYDVWWLQAQQTEQPIDWTRVADALPAKAKDVGVGFATAADFLDEKVLSTYERVWSERLERLLIGGTAPPFSDARATFEAILKKMGL